MSTELNGILSGMIIGGHIDDQVSFDNDAAFNNAKTVNIATPFGSFNITSDFKDARIIITRRDQRGDLITDGAINTMEIDAKTGVVLMEKATERDGEVSATLRDGRGNISGDTRKLTQRIRDFFRPHA